MRAWHWIVMGSLAIGLGACGGGSGSTGLVTSESGVVDDVRTNGTCEAFEGVPYCGSDSPNATAPGGESVSVVTSEPTPARTGTPGAAPTPTGAAGESPTPSGGGPNASPTAPPPTPTATPAAAASVTVVLEGFDVGAACASAARPLGSAAPWRTAPLVSVGTGGTPTTFLLPVGVPPPLDLALLCYDAPPAALPAELDTLADAEPTVVFVLPSP